MQEERYGVRTAEYSIWHRRGSTARYIGLEQAQLLSMIDVDVALYIEYDDSSKTPTVLIETARDIGQAFKTATVLKSLSQMSGLPGFVVLYKVDESKPNPSYRNWNDIESFRVKILNPHHSEWNWPQGFVTMTPKEYAEFLLTVRKWSAGRIQH